MPPGYLQCCILLHVTLKIPAASKQGLSFPRRTFLSLPIAAAAPAAPATPDWPQWRGPRRDGMSAETGLLKQWPAGGPRKLWQLTGLGGGYGTVALSGARLFLQAAVGKESCVLCLDRASGKSLWKTALGPTLTNDRGDGPRSTPTVEGNIGWALTENGDLACLESATGKPIWRRNILQDFGGQNPNWRLSESPLLDGNNLIVTPGGRGAGIVALDKLTGREVWRARELNDPAGYASCIVADVAGVRAIMNLTSQAGVGVRASDGKLLWHFPKPANRVANCATPLYSNGKVFYTSAYGTGCGLLRLTADAGALRADEVYFNREMRNHHGGVVLHGGHLYGFSDAILTCMEFETGNVLWRDRSVGKGALTYADGHLYLLGEGNTAGLAEATPAGYREKGRFPIPDSGLPSWAHPVVCDGKLWLRNQGWLACFDVRG
jgi:outer membrane protein assembly factor BamB